MSIKLSLMAGWLIIHRLQVQIALVAIVVITLAVAGILAPQMRLFAGDMRGGGG